MRRVALAALVLALAGCATATPHPLSTVDRWQQEVDSYADRLERFSAETRQLRDDFQALRDNASFAAVEEKIRDLAARTGSGAQQNPGDLLRPILQTMSLGELLLFHRFLSLSTRWMTLEATRSELESARLDLWVRRLRIERALPGGAGAQAFTLAARDPALVERPVPPGLSCRTYLVGDLVFASCE